MTNAEDAKMMEEALLRMNGDQREHLRLLIRELVRCYLDDDRHALVLFGTTRDRPITLVSVNTSDMDASHLLAAADEYVHFKVMEEAPPKEMFN